MKLHPLFEPYKERIFTQDAVLHKIVLELCEEPEQETIDDECCTDKEVL